jgi:hypothetical protein
MKSIPLSQGQVASVDDEDYERVLACNWHAVKSVRGRTFYAGTNTSRKSGKKRIIFLHHFILGVFGIEVDHINGDGLDNRKSNLRLATHLENGSNLPKQKNRSSRFKGVSWSKLTERWEAYICPRGRKIHLGLFEDESRAAKSYDASAERHYGKFARLNFPV